MQFWAKVKPKQSSPTVPKIGGEVSLRETSTPTTFPRITSQADHLNYLGELCFFPLSKIRYQIGDGGSIANPYPCAVKKVKLYVYNF
ncbi:hypothetical protein TNCV_4923181 [Trichonephila clavipes]|nr:hypothetical protein TNCV_4923181 [Trichonephila clavipes]